MIKSVRGIRVGPVDAECYEYEHKVWPWYWDKEATCTTRYAKMLSATIAAYFDVAPVRMWKIGYGQWGGGGSYSHGIGRIFVRTAAPSRRTGGSPTLFISNVIHETCHHVNDRLGFHDGHGPNFRAFLEIAMNRYALATQRAIGSMPGANVRLVETYSRPMLDSEYRECACGWQVRDDQLDRHLRENRH